jgi:hypothetical protein
MEYMRAIGFGRSVMKTNQDLAGKDTSYMESRTP